MSKIKALHDLVDLLADHDEWYQKRALDNLLQLVDSAEQAVADSHLTHMQRTIARFERRIAHYDRRGDHVMVMFVRSQLQELIDFENGNER